MATTIPSEEITKTIHDIVMDATRFADCITILERHGLKLYQNGTMWSGENIRWETFPEALHTVLRRQKDDREIRLYNLKREITELKTELKRYENRRPELKEIQNGEITLQIYDDDEYDIMDDE